MRRPRVAFSLAGGLVAGLLASLVPTGTGHADVSGRVPIAGLHSVASVVRDVDGVPHVKATNAHDLFFLQGWTHAEDRLFQMDVSRRRAAGTLAELLGSSALPSDVRMRTLGLRRSAERTMAVLSRDAQDHLRAYAEGVNAWIGRDELPGQYATVQVLGLSAAVIAIVVQAVVRVSRRALTHPSLIVLAVAAFLALTFFAVPFPIVVLGAGLVGWVLGRFWPAITTPPAKKTVDDGPAPLISDDHLHADQPSLRRSGLILTIGLTVWALPILAVGLAFGWDSIFVDQGLFFSGAALVTFGGAYAVLAYVAQQAVNVYGWVLPGEMVRGLALAETTPGPLIMVVQFVAFVGAYRAPGDLNPWTAAILASLLVTWVTFVPCFLFVLLGAPYVERLRHNRSLSAALTGITAAVVGVIANLAVYFAAHTLFTQSQQWNLGPMHAQIPVPASISLPAVALTAVACLLIFVIKWSVLRTLGACAILGILTQILLLR